MAALGFRPGLEVQGLGCFRIEGVGLSPVLGRFRSPEAGYGA